VLGLIAEGMSNLAIAARLYATERTVEAHVTQTPRSSACRNHPTGIGACSLSSPSCAPDQAVEPEFPNGQIGILTGPVHSQRRWRSNERTRECGRAPQ
jgi:hypothetical protein